MTPPRTITLLTDFGLADAYVGIMKGVILKLAPGATIVDITHDIPAQQIAEAGYLLRSAYRYFPAATIHVGVVDPGVGTPRRPVAIEVEHGTFVGPDNGLFWGALLDQKAVDPRARPLLNGRAVELTEEQYRLEPVSKTFHGRDIFAPAAAHLAIGVPLTNLGPEVTDLQPLRQQQPITRRGVLYGTVLHIDRFGNVISNIPAGSLPESPSVELAGRQIAGLAGSYQDARLVAIVGSSGLLEVAARNSSAADTLGVRVGDPVVVRNER